MLAIILSCMNEEAKWLTETYLTTENATTQKKSELHKNTFINRLVFDDCY